MAEPFFVAAVEGGEVHFDPVVDFVAGACHALWGHQETLSDTMFLFTPAETRVRSFTDTEDPFA